MFKEYQILTYDKEEYKKYQSRTLSEVEKDYLDAIKTIGDKAEKNK